MKRFGFMLASLFAVLTANSAPSQTKEIQDDIARKLAVARSASKTDEHIEIFRRLLMRALAPRNADLVFPENPLLANPTTNLPYRPPTALATEGTSIKGHGVVFIVTMPPVHNPLSISEKPADKAPSPWEREQRDLLGEKTETPKKTETGPPSVTETILRLLAENGKNFTELTPEEQITVAVIFRQNATPPAVPYYNFGQPNPLLNYTYPPGFPNPYGSYSGFPNTTTPYLYSPTYATPTQSVPKTETKEERKMPPEDMFAPFRNSMALGALHLRQGKPKAAEKVYREVLGQCDDMLKALEKLPPETSRAERLSAVMMGIELHGKLAQIHLTEGNNEAAASALKAAAEFNRKLEQFTSTQYIPPAAPRSQLPTKLVISALKKNLDRIGDGKMSFDEFRKSASIEYTGVAKDAKP